MASGRAAEVLFLHCLTKYSAYQRDIYSTNVRTLHQYMPPTSKDFTCSDSLEVSSAIVLSAIHKFDCLNHKTKRAICKLCRLLVRKHYFYNVLATNVNRITTLKKRRRDHESRPPLKANGSIRQRTCVVIVAKVSLPAVEQSRVTPAGIGHTTDVLAFSAMSCATVEIILLLCANNAHCNPFRSPTTRLTTTSVTSLRLPRHQTLMMRDVLWMALTTNPTNLTVFFLRKDLHLIHLNARNLLPKLDELNVLASKTKAAVIGVSET